MTYLRAFAALACVALLVPAVAADTNTRAPATAVTGAAAPSDPLAALVAGAPSCAAGMAAAYDAVARNVYAQAASGRAPAAASARLTRSPALVAAVARNDPRGVRVALAPLLRGQIKRIVVARGGRRLVALGHGPALAPVSGSLGGGTFTLSVATVSGIAGIVHELTGRAGDAPARDRARAGHRVPSGRRHLALSGHPPCEPVFAGVARRLLRGEVHGPHVRHVVALVGRDARFARAVAGDDPAALRAQIVRFFRDPRLHVVRIRATRHGRLVNDVGGPDVLAPASGPVILHGRVVGRVTLSIQDDAGYLKLLHRFTGATVALTGSGPHLTLPRFPTGTLEVFAREPTAH